ncbi:hypothetical protein [Rubellimicrobium aerolatum]|uniref:Response regulatory domain-containing protein n=1 Tax=Rubellimicrobium aerolatum TaxID=490979 RepID=A0ABW0SEE5_9RHOB|nr:hypothetical protein [Rubellimicrobium aerolatum]MBP1805617.1 hypothetical protein [Rubellimicrobium aerolatum]
MQVLIVEGDSSLRAQVATALMPAGFDVLAFALSGPAKEAARRNRIDLLVLGEGKGRDARAGLTQDGRGEDWHDEDGHGEGQGAALPLDLALLADWRNPRLATILLSDRRGDALEEAFALLPSLQAVLGRRPDPRTLAQVALSAVPAASHRKAAGPAAPTAMPARAAATVSAVPATHPDESAPALSGSIALIDRIPEAATAGETVPQEERPGPVATMEASIPHDPAAVPIAVPIAVPAIVGATPRPDLPALAAEAPRPADPIRPTVPAPETAPSDHPVAALRPAGPPHAPASVDGSAQPSLPEPTLPSSDPVPPSRTGATAPDAATPAIPPPSAGFPPSPPPEAARPERRLRLSMAAPGPASVPARPPLPSFAEPAPPRPSPSPAAPAVLSAAETRALLSELARRYSRIAGEPPAAPGADGPAPGPRLLQHG